MYRDELLNQLVGKKILAIFMNEDYLKFETDKGIVAFQVDGDCCSQSVFYDFIGVDKLLNNGTVTEVNYIDLNPNLDEDRKNYQEAISVYGCEIVTEHPKFGEQTSVFSFRNYSNGYYGGSLEAAPPDTIVYPQIFDDVYETACPGKFSTFRKSLMEE